MKTIVNIDGEIYEKENAKISVFDRGFLYGDSVYEVVRSYGDVIFAFKEHLFRLKRSADMLDMELPLPLPQIESETKRTLAQAGTGDAYVRIICTRGEGEITLDPQMAVGAHFVIIVKDYEAPPRHLYTEGASVITIKSGKLADGAVPPGVKTGNYLTNVMALYRARRKGSYEAILIDGNGKITEGTTCNFFIVKNGVIITPSLEVGILPGITRGIILELCHRWGFKSHEQDIFVEDLSTAQEAFITSTLRDVMPVTIIDGKPVGDGKPGTITENIRRAYIEYVKEYIACHSKKF